MPLAAVLLALVAAAIAVALDVARPVEADAPAVTTRFFGPAAVARKASRRWLDPRTGWYRQYLDRPDAVTLWHVVHLFGATNALAIAHPTPGRLAAARNFAKAAERYWNPDLRPVGGYGATPGARGAQRRTWFDDNGWWGIAFYDTYRATGDRRYLSSAGRALRFMDTSGWDRHKGGIWWDTNHSFKAGESLGTGTLLAASLYRATRQKRYLAMANKYIKWADADFRGDDGLYDRHERDPTPMPYVQGPMAEAFLILCRATGKKAYCDEGEELADRAAKRFPKLTMGPQYDAMYIRSLLQIYKLDHNPRWYRIAAAAASRALRNARAPGGLYLRTWDGKEMSSVGGRAGMLQAHAATTSVLAWMAATRPPR
jgi:hypothetical protein